MQQNCPSFVLDFRDHTEYWSYALWPVLDVEWMVQFSKYLVLFQVAGVRWAPPQWRNGTEISPLCLLGHPKGESTTAAVVEQVVAPLSLSADFFLPEVDDAIIPNLVWVLTLILPSQNPAWHHTMSRAYLSQHFKITLPQLQCLAHTTTALPWWPWQQGYRQQTVAFPAPPWWFHLYCRLASWGVRRLAVWESALSAWWNKPWTASHPSKPVSIGRVYNVCDDTFKLRSVNHASMSRAPSAMSSFTPTTCEPSWKTADWWESTKISCCGESWPWILTHAGVLPRTVGKWHVLLSDWFFITSSMSLGSSNTKCKRKKKKNIGGGGGCRVAQIQRQTERSTRTKTGICLSLCL